MRDLGLTVPGRWEHPTPSLAETSGFGAAGAVRSTTATLPDCNRGRGWGRVGGSPPTSIAETSSASRPAQLVSVEGGPGGGWRRRLRTVRSRVYLPQVVPCYRSTADRRARMSDLSFMQYLDLHHAIHEILVQHQVHLVSGRLAEARDRFARFDAEIRQHIQEEEAEMMPIYEERGGAPPGGAPELFAPEHRKIEKHLDEIAAALEALEVGHARGVIDLLEREYKLKQLLLHHDLREKNFLYPILDRVATAEEKKRIVSLLEGRPGQ